MTGTSRSGDLVARLRGDKYTCRENMGCGTMEFCACATMDDAAARIEALEAALQTLVNEHEVLGFVGGPSAEAWDAARAALGEKQ